MNVWISPTGEEVDMCSGCPERCAECAPPADCQHGRPWGECFPCTLEDERAMLRRAIRAIVDRVAAGQGHWT